jgi:hypothetical protein
MSERYFLGLDLGQSQDFTALVALRREDGPPSGYSGRPRHHYEVRGVKRWPLRTAYTRIAQDVAALVERPPLAGCTLGIDKTGVGAGVLEIIAAARPNAVLRPVLITCGHAVTGDGVTVHVPKVELVSVTTAILDNDRLAIPPTVPEAKTLATELRQFRAKVTPAGRETFEADWRTRSHDDLVLGLAIGLWLGENLIDPPDPPIWVAPPGQPPTEAKPLHEWTGGDVLRDLGYTDDDDGHDWQPDPWRA